MMHDTTPDMEALQFELIMRHSPEERFRMGLSMCRSARRIVLSSLPKNLTPTERRIAYFMRVYGHEFSEKENEKIIRSIREWDADHPISDEFL